VERARARLKAEYTLVFADPPYDDDGAMLALGDLVDSGLLAAGATLVLEHSRRRTPPPTLGLLHLDWTRRYGDSQVSIYREAGLAAGQSKEELQ
jgi:16S rRNA G966 N2-methylase RsmD